MAKILRHIEIYIENATRYEPEATIEMQRALDYVASKCEFADAGRLDSSGVEGQWYINDSYYD